MNEVTSLADMSLSDMTKAELLDLAIDKDISVTSSMNKQQIIDTIENNLE